MNNIIYEFIDKDQERELIDDINTKGIWENTLSRKTQQYGYKYDYGNTNIKPTLPIPDWLTGIKDEAHPSANQIIINHYYPGQGIASHIDHPKFGDKIVSISLNSGCMMDFECDENTKYMIYLEPRSCIILEGDYRWKLKHGIAKRQSDLVDGNRIKRKERISITLREYLIHKD